MNFYHGNHFDEAIRTRHMIYEKYAKIYRELVERYNEGILSVEEFFDDVVYYVPGEMMAFSEVYDQYLDWLDPAEIHDWSKIKFGKELPTKFPKGRRKSDGTHYIGNMSFTPKESTGPKIIVRSGRLCPSAERPE